MKNWIPLLIGIFGSMPWWARALLSPQLQQTVDKYLNPIAIKWLGIICIIISFILSNYFAWKNQKEQNIKLITKLHALTIPQLNGRIEYSIIGHIDECRGTNIMMLISIINAGAPSIIEGWSLSVDNPQIHLSGIRPTVIPNGYKLYRGAMGQDILAELNQDDAIWDKTLVPIQQGNIVKGWLRFVLKNTNYEIIKQKETKLTITFVDYLGKSYSITDDIDIPGNKEMKEPFYVPGTRDIFKLPSKK